MLQTIKFIFLTYLIAVEGKVMIFVTDSPLQRIGSRIYKKELLTDKYQDPKELAYDSSSRTLYFMYMDDVIQNSGRAWINIVTKESMKINGIRFNKATAVDPDTSEVYFGSENGLYTYDPITNEATNVGLYNVNILKLIVRNNEMYMIDANNHMLYKVFEGTRTVRIGDWKTVMQFDVDNDRNIHFVTMCGVFCAVDGHETVKNNDLSTVHHFIVSENRTLGVTENAIYEINCRNGTASKLTDLDFDPRSIILGDYGDIFYSIDNSIYRLKPINSFHIYKIHKRGKQ